MTLLVQWSCFSQSGRGILETANTQRDSKALVLTCITVLLFFDAKAKRLEIKSPAWRKEDKQWKT